MGTANISVSMQATGPKGDPGSPATVSDASTTVKGKLQLSGDLGGTAASPTIKRTVTKTVAPTGTLADYNTDGTADDVQINAAITAVNGAGGGIVHLKAGTYTTTATVSLKSNVTLEGEGSGISILKAANSNIDFHVVSDINGINNVILRDLEVDGNKANNLTNTTGHNIRIGHQSTNVRIQNVYTHDSPSHGLITAYDNSLPNDLIFITNVRSDNNGTNANGSGLYMNGNSSIFVNGFEASGNELDGIQWKTSTALEINNVVSRNNKRFGMFAVDGHANISNSDIYNSGTIGLHVQGGGELANTTVAVNNIRTYGNQGDGVRLDGVNYCLFSNIRSYNNNQSAGTNSGLRLVVTVGGTVTHNRFVNCSFYDDQGSPTQTYGIWGTGSTAPSLNYFSNCGAFGNKTTQVRQDSWASDNILDNIVGANPRTMNNIGSVGGAKNFDPTTGIYQRVTLTGNSTFTISAGTQVGQTITIQISQDSTGGRTIVWSGTRTLFAQGGFTYSQAASAINEYTFIWDGSNWHEISRAIGSNVRSIVMSDATSFTPTADTADVNTQVNTQLAGTLTANAPSGTPADGQKLTLRIKSTSAQTFSWNVIYRSGTDVVLPTASSGSSKTDYIGFVYNSADSKWDCIAYSRGY